MDEQLELTKSLFSDTTIIRYENTTTSTIPSRQGEVVLNPSKLKSCPNVTMFLEALNKKCTRVKVMRQQKYSGALCIALLASRHYCITSLELKNIPDTTVEVCWESLDNISITVPEPLKSWILSVLDKRSYITYGALFCQRKFLSSQLLLSDHTTSTMENFKLTLSADQYISTLFWDRDDAVTGSLYSHFRHEARDISDDRERIDKFPSVT